MALELDRIAVEAVGASPDRLAAAILQQLPGLSGAVPVYDIAHALDIEEIREEPLSGFEGCLLTDAGKSRGAVLVNAASSPERRRYTLGHELCHFLSERHRPTEDDGFHCTREDMGRPRRLGRHLRQEQEANRFAIELLAPRRLIAPYLGPPAALEHALSIATAQAISREAAVRRYVALQGECLAAAFLANGHIRYIEKSKAFPGTTVWAGDPAPPLPPRPRGSGDLGTLDEVSADLWLSRPGGISLFAQALTQANGHATVLLLAEREAEDDEVRHRAPWET